MHRRTHFSFCDITLPLSIKQVGTSFGSQFSFFHEEILIIEMQGKYPGRGLALSDSLIMDTASGVPNIYMVKPVIKLMVCGMYH